MPISTSTLGFPNRKSRGSAILQPQAFPRSRPEAPWISRPAAGNLDRMVTSSPVSSSNKTAPSGVDSSAKATTSSTTPSYKKGSKKGRRGGSGGTKGCNKPTAKKAIPTLRAKDGTLVERPKRFLTAYNIFFQHERQRLLRELPERRQGQKKPRNSHGKINFTELAQTIAASWKAITADDLRRLQALSTQDRERYKREMKVWKQLQGEAAGAASSNQEEHEEEKEAKRNCAKNRKASPSETTGNGNAKQAARPFHTTITTAIPLEEEEEEDIPEPILYDSSEPHHAQDEESRIPVAAFPDFSSRQVDPASQPPALLPSRNTRHDPAFIELVMNGALEPTPLQPTSLSSSFQTFTTLHPSQVYDHAVSTSLANGASFQGRQTPFLPNIDNSQSYPVTGPQQQNDATRTGGRIPSHHYRHRPYAMNNESCCWRNKQDNLQHLAQSLGSDNVAALIRAFRE